MFLKTPRIILAASGLVISGLFFWSHQAWGASFLQFVTVKNIPPQVTQLVLGDGPSGGYIQSLTLRQQDTATIYLRGYATDPTSCFDFDTPQSWKIVAYRSDLPEKENCIASAENCYQVNAVNDLMLSGCTEPKDTTIDYLVPIIFLSTADPTDSGSLHADSNWTVSIQITDEAGQKSPQRVATFEMNSLLAYTVTPSINYGNLRLGETSSSQEVEFINTGNRDLFVNNFSLSDFQCTGFLSRGIPSSNVKVALDAPEGESPNETFLLPRKSNQNNSTRKLFLSLHMPEERVGGTCNNSISFQVRAVQ